MARCASARCAVRLIGRLAETHGYYTAEWDRAAAAGTAPAAPGEWGEALTLADGAEAWVMHVLPDDTGGSAAWCARRVPEGHVAVVANMFTIRAVPRAAAARGGDEHYMASAGLFALAERSGLGVWLDANRTLLDFAASFGPAPLVEGGLPDASPYSTRRVWRALALAAPSRVGHRKQHGGARLGEQAQWLPADGVTRTRLGDPLPFSLSPDAPLGARDVMAIMRDLCVPRARARARSLSL